MSRKTVSAIMMFLLVLSTLALAFKIQPVRASRTITINADGSITPSTAPIYSADNITYTLTGNITADADGIVIERDNITIDGAGYTVQGISPQASDGIYLDAVSNVTIKNTTIEAFDFGIWLNSSLNSSVSGNSVTANNEVGIDLDSSSGISVSENNITGNYNGIYLGDSSSNIVSENSITNNANGLRLDSSSNNTISENNITNNYNVNRLAGNGILGLGSTYNSVSRNNLTNNDNGIDLESSSDHNSVSGNNITANIWADIYAGGCSNNSFSGNDITHSKLGFNMNSGSTGNIVSGNNITDNDEGIFNACSDNSFFHNNFINNGVQVSTNPTNIWDDGYPSGGNYWGDYNGTDANHDGIGDTPYVIDASNIDHYPFMIQYVIPEFPSFLILSLFLIATLLTVIIYRKKHAKISGIRSFSS